MNYFSIKHFLFSLFLIICYSSIAQTILTPGDIQVIGFKTNTTTDAGNDAIKLVTLVDLQCNTKFIVTDNNWNNGTSSWACNDDEFGIEITCTSAIQQGSVFYIEVNASADPANCSGGSITRADLGSPWGVNYGLSSNGDNVYVLQGTRAAPVFIYALKHIGAFSNTTCSNKDQAGLPTGLILGTSAVVMSSTQNQWHYNCVTNTGTKAALKTAISTNANWVSTGGQSWNNSSGIFVLTSPGISYGVLAVSGAGCGCLANCELAYSGGVNCGSAGVTGNCTAGYQNMSANINVPSGCTYNVTATMKNRSYGCGSSGADGNCQTCDVVKVDILAGVKLFQQGASNSTLTDSYSVSGPATIVVSGKSDRADEIITYGIQITPCSCITTVLPIELTEFKATPEDKNVVLNWSTATEHKNDFYTVERSANAIDWESISFIKAIGNSYSTANYSIFDSSPLPGISYYRLKQTDTDGRYTYSNNVSINMRIDLPSIVKRINVYGEELDENATGLIIEMYDNGTIKKLFK